MHANYIRLVLRYPIRIWHRINYIIMSPWRSMLLQVQARLYGASLKFGRNVRFKHMVRFQGYGSVTIGDHVIFGYELVGALNQPILLQPREIGSVIHLEKGVQLMNGCELIARSSISIGQRCLIGPKCTFLDSDFHGIGPNERNLPGLTEPIVVEENVWLGSEVMVLKGVRIGKDSIVGARSVVVKDVPPGAIVVGNPARVVGTVYGHEESIYSDANNVSIYRETLSSLHLS